MQSRHDDELTLSEAALVIGGRSPEAARKQLDRATQYRRLPFHYGLDAGRRVKMVYRTDLVLWRSTWFGPDDDDRDDEMGPLPDDAAIEGEPPTPSREPTRREAGAAMEYMREQVKTMQALADALTEANRVLGERAVAADGRYQVAQAEITRLRTEMDALRERASRAEGRAEELSRHVQTVQDSPWWRRWWRVRGAGE